MHSCFGAKLAPHCGHCRPSCISQSTLSLKCSPHCSQRISSGFLNNIRQKILPGNLQVHHLHSLRQPDAVLGEEELPACPPHLGGLHLEDDRLAVPLGDFRRGGFVGGEVNVLAAHRLEAFFANGVEETRGG